MAEEIIPDEMGEIVIDSDADDVKPDEVEEPEKEEPEKKEVPDVSGEINELREQFKAEKEASEQAKATLQKELEDLRKENNRLGYALRKAEKHEKTDDGEAVFTDAQLLQMMKDHQEEPEVLFQIIKQMQKQAGASIEKSAEQKAEIQNKRGVLNGMAEQAFPNAFKEGSELHNNILQQRSYLGLDDNPYGDYLALASMALNNMPNLVTNLREQIKKELLDKNVDEKRKEKVKANALPDGGRKPEEKTPKALNIDDTAKRLNMNKRQREIYEKLMSKSKKTGVSVQADN